MNFSVEVGGGGGGGIYYTLAIWDSCQMVIYCNCSILLGKGARAYNIDKV